MKHLIEIKIRGYHLDIFQHVNNARYLEFFEEARWAMLEESVLQPSYFAKQNVSFAVVNININYRRGARFGDVLKIESSLSRIGRKSATIHQRASLKDDGSLIVDADVTFVIIDNITGKAIPLTEEITRNWPIHCNN
ncbi:MAG: thioesterase family protein [Smithella sp.]